MARKNKNEEQSFPWLQMDGSLDLKAAQLASHSGLSIQTAIGGLYLFWRQITREDARRALLEQLRNGWSDAQARVLWPVEVIRKRLRMSFGTEIDPEVMVDLEFLEAADGGRLRIRGASKRQVRTERTRLAQIQAKTGKSLTEILVELLPDDPQPPSKRGTPGPPKVPHRNGEPQVPPRSPRGAPRGDLGGTEVRGKSLLEDLGASNVFEFPVSVRREEASKSKILSPPPPAAAPSAEIEGVQLWQDARGRHAAQLNRVVEKLSRTTLATFAALWPKYAKEQWVGCFNGYLDPRRSVGAQFAEDDWPLATLLVLTVLERKMPEALPPAPLLPEDCQPATEAGRCWAAAMRGMREEGKTYALEWLAKLRPLALSDGVLTLQAPDTYFVAWVEDHYGQLLESFAGCTVKLVIVEREGQAFG